MEEHNRDLLVKEGDVDRMPSIAFGAIGDIFSCSSIKGSETVFSSFDGFPGKEFGFFAAGDHFEIDDERYRFVAIDEKP